MQRLVERALSNPSWGIEYEDESWFVTVPKEWIMNPESGYGWKSSGNPPKNNSSRKKGKETFNAYISLDIKEQRVSHRYTSHTNRWETIEYLKERLSAHERIGHDTLVMFWDPASWHRAKDIKLWVREHNGRVRREGIGVRLLTVDLPVHAFWLNPVEPIIMHIKSKALPCRQFGSQSDHMASIDRHILHRNLRLAAIPNLNVLLSVLH